MFSWKTLKNTFLSESWKILINFFGIFLLSELCDNDMVSQISECPLDARRKLDVH